MIGAATFPQSLQKEYSPLRIIGEGAWSVVWLAENSEGYFAIKVLRTLELDLQEEKRRFDLECSLAGQKIHSNLVPIIRGGESDGYRYLITKYIEGETLGQYLERHRPLPYGQMLEWLSQLAKALQALHERGLVHRDVKPDNIIVSTDGKVHLLDLGLARKLDVPGPTKTGIIVGTPNYVAPELCRGEKAGPMADVFALGLVGLQCLAVKNIFKEDDLQSLLWKRAAGEEQIEIPKCAPKLVKELLESLTKNDPALRPANGDLVFRLIEECFAQGNELEASAEHAPTRFVGKQTKKTRATNDDGHRKRLVSAVAIVAISALLFTLGYTWYLNVTELQVKVAQQEVVRFRRMKKERECLENNLKFREFVSEYISDERKRRATGHKALELAKRVQRPAAYETLAHCLEQLRLAERVNTNSRDGGPLEFASRRFVPCLDLIFRLPRPTNALERRAAAELIWKLQVYGTLLRMHGENNLKEFAAEQSNALSNTKNVLKSIRSFAEGFDERTKNLAQYRVTDDLRQLIDEFKDEKSLPGSLVIIYVRMAAELGKTDLANREFDNLSVRKDDRKFWPFLGKRDIELFLSSAKFHLLYWQERFDELDIVVGKMKTPNVPWLPKERTRPSIEWDVWRNDTSKYFASFNRGGQKFRKPEDSVPKLVEVLDSISHLDERCDKWIRLDLLAIVHKYLTKNQIEVVAKKYPKLFSAYEKKFGPW